MTEAIGPSWVMMGQQSGPDHVTLYASNTLTYAELRAEIDDLAPWDMDGPFVRVTRTYTLDTRMDQVVVIHACDWPSAFRSLFDQWTPERGERPQIAAQLALPHGDTP